MHQPAPVKAHAEPTITVNTQKLSAVDRFTYLGSILSRAVHTDDEVDTRIARASAAFGIFPSNVWERKGISLETKLKVYKAVILSSLLYARDTWTVHSRHAKKLKHLHMSCLGKLLKIRLVMWSARSMNTYQRSYSMASFWQESVPKAAKTNASRIPRRLPPRALTLTLRAGRASLKIAIDGAAASPMALPSLSRREPVRPQGDVNYESLETAHFLPTNLQQYAMMPSSRILCRKC